MTMGHIGHIGHCGGRGHCEKSIITCRHGVWASVHAAACTVFVLLVVSIPFAVAKDAPNANSVAAAPEAAPTGEGTCRFIQTCFTPNLDVESCHPRPVFPNETHPRPYTGGYQNICPEFKDAACCSEQQRQALDTNFQLIAATMGALAGSAGCAACGQNLRDLWCLYTCGPDQRMIETLGFETIPDPVNTPNNNTVLKTRAVIAREYACSIYQSCRDTSYAREFAPLSTCAGFLNYQGVSEAIGHGAHIDWVYSDDPSQLRIEKPAYQCQSFNLPHKPTPTNDSCSCSSCLAACQAVDVQVDVLNGFHGWVVGVVYGCIAVASVLAVFFQRRRDQRAAQAAKRSTDAPASMQDFSA